MTIPLRSIVIVGGGYAGLICANRLRSSLSPDESLHTRITLINASDSFYERIRLHELAAGTRDSVATPLTELLHPDIELVVGTARQIDPEAHVVDIDQGGTTSVRHYDRLVYAVGSSASTARVPGASEYTYAIADPCSAQAAAAAISAGPSAQRIVVVGGGFTGVETASEVAERHPRASVTLIAAGDIVPAMRPAARRVIARKLERLGVQVVQKPIVHEVAVQQLRFSDDSTLDFDVCLWTAGFSVPRLATVSGLACDDRGRLRVDEQLRSIDAPDIIGAGDAVRLPASTGTHLRMGCAAALPLGGAAALTVLADLRGTEAPTASVGFLVQCLSLGRRDGYIQVVSPADQPRPLAITGRLGATVKEAICAMTLDGPAKEAKKPGSYWAPKGPKPTPRARRVGFRG